MINHIDTHVFWDSSKAENLKRLRLIVESLNFNHASDVVKSFFIVIHTFENGVIRILCIRVAIGRCEIDRCDQRN